ncbi:MAG: sporulation protein YqfD [Lachnospiraceae bacterium]|nr:sporulation protein YqfD [Lachnospiraceae bacterium]
MNRRDKWQGQLTVRVTGGSPERFFNLCSFHGIWLEAMEQTEGGISVLMKAKEFFQAARLAKKADVKLRITEKKGLPFWMKRSRKRLAFYMGILLCLGLLYASSLFIWDIHMEGNLKYTDSTLLQFLEEQGYVHGMAKSGILCEDIEKAIRNRYNDITWVSAQITGNRLIIRIKENELTEPEQEAEPAALGHDVTAKKSGKVVSIITRTGTPQVHVGDEVEAGQILIAGTLDIFDEGGNLLKTEQVQADGDIIAATLYHYEDQIPLSSPKKHYTGEEKERHYLWLFGRRLFLPGGKNHYELFDETDTYETLHLWENFYLPLGYGTVTAREYEEALQVLSEEEARAKADKRFEDYCKSLAALGVTIKEAACSVEVNGDSCIATGTIYAEEAIGK